MNKNDLFHSFNGIDNDIPQRSQRSRPPWVKWVTPAACLAVVLLAILLSKPLFGTNGPEEPSTADTPVIIESTGHTDSPTPPPEETTSGVDVNDPAIIWGGSDAVDSADDLGMMPTLPNQMAVTYALKAALDEAEDDDLFAIVVTKYRTIRGEESDRYNKETYGALLDAREQANEALAASAQKVTAELMDTFGISRREADARRYSVPEFMEARNAAKAAKSAVSSYLLEWNFDSSHYVLDQLVELGFTLVYDATDPAYQAYLSLIYPYTPLGVVIGTKAQICALDAEELGYYCCFHMAAKNAADYEVTDNYSHSEVHLTGDSKLTDELIAAYTENGGAALRVEVAIGYFGKEYTPEEMEQAALASTGLTWEEFQYCNDIEIVQRYIETKNRLMYHKDHNEELAVQLFAEHEFIEIRHSAEKFIAELTYQRALELVQNKEVAYIELVDQTPSVQSTLDSDGDL